MKATDYTEQKAIAQALDTCASRAHYVNANPATSKQCWFLAGLLLKDEGTDHGFIYTDTSYILTSREASRFIDELLKRLN